MRKAQIVKVQEENRNNYNKNRREPIKYELGCLVAIKRTQFGSGLKLIPKYLGPYRITKIKRNDRYDVEKVDVNTSGPLRTSTAADHMKPWANITDNLIDDDKIEESSEDET